MITFPNCKINIGLWVTQRRADGYHNIQTLMVPVPWCDALEIVPTLGSQTTLTITGNKVDATTEENLCFLAWKLMAEKYNIPAVEMHLHKVIPSGAGLGGGSADAAFTLKMLNSLFKLNLDSETLRSLAVQLGMDCPFFIDNVPALSTGRGEFLKPITLKINGLNIVIVKPPIHVSTAAAFAGIKPQYRENSLADFCEVPIQAWKKKLKNDFEQSVFGLYPDIEELKNRMYRKGAVYASMSGSGSAVYGLFENQPFGIDFPEHEMFQALLRSQP
jgi:4-diphosphocytidyl-2-C-methyl-D-erythritol kinase